MTVRVLVVGTGFGARVVAPVFAATPGCEVAAVISARDDVVAAIAEHRPSLVSVHSPPFLHAAHVTAAADHGAAVLCDKPCTTSAADTAALLAAVEARGAKHFVNFEFRFDPARAYVRELVGAGAIGAVRHVVWTHHSAGSRVPLRPHGWLFDAALGGGWIGAWGSHAIDALRWILGGDVTVDVSRPRTDIAERPDRNGRPRASTAEDGFAATLHGACGTTITIDSTFAAAASLAPRLVVLGDDGAIECVADARVRLRARGERGERSFAAEPGTDQHRLPMERWALVVRDVLRHERDLADVPTLADGLACDRVLDALRAGR
jgi:predicted dehydrogenase